MWKRILFAAIVLVLSVAISCVNTGLGPIRDLDAIRREAYDHAVECYGKATVPLDSIYWTILEGRSTFALNTIEGERVILKAWYNPETRRIWITETYAYSMKVNAHEILHALGVQGHPAEIFTRCRIPTE
jgi:hypothetical protein